MICVVCKKEIDIDVDRFEWVNESKSEYVHLKCKKIPNPGTRLKPDELE